MHVRLAAVCLYMSYTSVLFRGVLDVWQLALVFRLPQLNTLRRNLRTTDAFPAAAMHELRMHQRWAKTGAGLFAPDLPFLVRSFAITFRDSKVVRQQVVTADACD